MLSKTLTPTSEKPPVHSLLFLHPQLDSLPIHHNCGIRRDSALRSRNRRQCATYCRILRDCQASLPPPPPEQYYHPTTAPSHVPPSLLPQSNTCNTYSPTVPFHSLTSTDWTCNLQSLALHQLSHHSPPAPYPQQHPDRQNTPPLSAPKRPADDPQDSFHPSVHWSNLIATLDVEHTKPSLPASASAEASPAFKERNEYQRETAPAPATSKEQPRPP